MTTINIIKSSPSSATVSSPLPGTAGGQEEIIAAPKVESFDFINAPDYEALVYPYMLARVPE